MTAAIAHQNGWPLTTISTTTKTKLEIKTLISDSNCKDEREQAAKKFSYAACVVTYIVFKLLGPYAEKNINTAWESVKTLLITWGLWLLFMVFCIKTTYFHSK